jgi:hypothetical protein
MELNPKTAWYRQHKDDPALRECMRIARKKYYDANKQKESARSLARYYRLKAEKVVA